MEKNLTKIATTVAVAAMMILPAASFANDYRAQRDKNQWTNLAIGSGAVGLLGLIGHNDTVATLGFAGAGYSAYRAGTVQANDCYSNDWRHHDLRFDRDDHRSDRDRR